MNKIILFFLFLALFGCSENKLEEIPESHKLLKDHMVPDQETARRIAEVVWVSHYGLKIYNNKPFKVHLERNIDTVWHVEGTFPEDMDVGGVPYIAIRSRTSEILKLSHGK